MTTLELKDLCGNVIFSHTCEDNNYIITLEKAIEENVNLKFIDMQYKYLKDVDFKSTDLTWANFKGAYLRNCNFKNANCEHTCFKNSDIKDAKFA